MLLNVPSASAEEPVFAFLGGDLPHSLNPFKVLS
jgi:hypothetical protein